MRQDKRKGSSRKKAGRKKQMKPDTKARIAIMAIVGVFSVSMLVSSFQLYRKLDAGEQKISELTQEQEDEEARTQEIADERQEMQSDEYKEQIAKDSLGIVYDGEIVFKEEDSQ